VTALALGLAAGILSALFGVSGAILTVPGMVWWLNLRHPRAVGTSLAAVLPTSVAGVLAYRESPQIKAEWDWWVVAELAVTGVVGAIAGAIVHRLPAARQARRYLGVLAILAGMLMVYQAARPAGASPATWHAVPHLHWAALSATGLLTGLVSSLLGIGGGVAMVPVLVLALRFPQQLAQAVSLAVLIPVALSGALAHRRRGNLIPNLAVWLAIGGIVGVEVSAWWILKLTDALLRGLFGAFLVTVGVSTAAGKKE
jgi:uncharacterized membrane protein YfcA